MKPTWDETMFGLMDVIAQRSDDQRTKVGCVIVRPDNTVVSMGYNGAPRGVSNSRVSDVADQNHKYPYVVHADANAIFNAGRLGVALHGCTMYLPFLPCSACAQAIIQSGITRLRIRDGGLVMARWQESCEAGLEMMHEAGIDTGVSHVEFQASV